MLPYEIVKGKDSAIRQKISYCDLGIFKCLNISFSRESSQPTTFFHFFFWNPYKQLIKTSKMSEDVIVKALHYMFFFQCSF